MKYWPSNRVQVIPGSSHLSRKLISITHFRKLWCFERQMLRSVATWWTLLTALKEVFGYLFSKKIIWWMMGRPIYQPAQKGFSLISRINGSLLVQHLLQIFFSIIPDGRYAPSGSQPIFTVSVLVYFRSETQTPGRRMTFQSDIVKVALFIFGFLSAWLWGLDEYFILQKICHAKSVNIATQLWWMNECEQL